LFWPASSQYAFFVIQPDHFFGLLPIDVIFPSWSESTISTKYLASLQGGSMPSRKTGKTKKKQISPRLKWIAGISAAVVVMGIAVMFTATQFENHNSFCASCHTQDEENYYKQSLQTNSVDLATFHEMKQTRCIDCHTGRGVSGRVGGLMAGASDLVSYFSGHYPQPAIQDNPISDGNCLKCHEKIFDKKDMNNHFHIFLPRWQGLDRANAATCVSCHGGHDQTGDSKIAFLNKDKTSAICQKCHETAAAQ
jgi:predicted CXXCH cytochrome family protein